MPFHADHDPLRQKIRLLLAPAHEMVTSLHVLADPSHHAGSAAWAEAALRAMTPDLRGEVEYFGHHFNQWLDIADLLHHAAQDAPIDRVLAALKAGPAHEVARVACGEEDGGLTADVQRAREAARSHPEAFKRRLLACLSRYREDVFAAEWELRRPLLQAALAREAAHLDRTDPIAYLTGLNSRISYDNATGELIFHKYRDFRYAVVELDRITCIPSTFAAPHLMIGNVGRDLIIFVNVSTAAAPQPARVPPDLLAALKALADETRLAIFKAVVKQPRYTQELATNMGLAEPTVSRHLKMLREAGLVSSEKQGGFVYYRADLHRMDALPQLLRAYFRN